MVMMSIQALKQRQHCVYALNYHLVIVTKYRRKCLTSAMLDEIRRIAEERAAAWEGALIEMNGEADHCHFLLSLPPHRAVSDFANMLKTNTSRLLRRDFREHLDKVYLTPVLWSRSYCVISVGGLPLDVLRKYIEQQERPD